MISFQYCVNLLILMVILGPRPFRPGGRFSVLSILQTSCIIYGLYFHHGKCYFPQSNKSSCINKWNFIWTAETVETISTLTIFEVTLCYISSNERKTWKFQAWTGLKPWALRCRCGALVKLHNVAAKVINIEINKLL